jgi:hypothetical protein
MGPPPLSKQQQQQQHRRRRGGAFNHSCLLVLLLMLGVAATTTHAAMGGRLAAFLSSSSSSSSGSGRRSLLPSLPWSSSSCPAPWRARTTTSSGGSSSPFLQQQQLAQVRGGASLSGGHGLLHRTQGALLALPAELAALASGPVGVGVGTNTALALLGIAVKQRWLTSSGLLHAWILGVALWSTLGWRGWLICVLYLVFGSLVTKVKQKEKEAKGIAEKRGGARGPENVWGSAAAVRVFGSGLGKGLWMDGVNLPSLSIDRRSVLTYGITPSPPPNTHSQCTHAGNHVRGRRPRAARTRAGHEGAKTGATTIF